jgi:hypothetical protein
MDEGIVRDAFGDGLFCIDNIVQLAVHLSTFPEDDEDGGV